MPIYEYRREDGTTFEVIQQFSDEPLESDPETGQKVQRIYRAPAIHFKGSGFHNTDYGSKRRPKAGSDDSSSAAKPTGGESSSGSNTPAKSSSSDSSPSPSKPGESGKSGKSGGDSAKPAATTASK